MFLIVVNTHSSNTYTGFPFHQLYYTIDLHVSVDLQAMPEVVHIIKYNH